MTLQGPRKRSWRRTKRLSKHCLGSVNWQAPIDASSLGLCLIDGGVYQHLIVCALAPKNHPHSLSMEHQDGPSVHRLSFVSAPCKCSMLVAMERVNWEIHPTSLNYYRRLFYLFFGIFSSFLQKLDFPLKISSLETSIGDGAQEKLGTWILKVYSSSLPVLLIQ